MNTDTIEGNKLCSYRVYIWIVAVSAMMVFSITHRLLWGRHNNISKPMKVRKATSMTYIHIPHFISLLCAKIRGVGTRGAAGIFALSDLE